jgi:hypothetical protein
MALSQTRAQRPAGSWWKNETHSVAAAGTLVDVPNGALFVTVVTAGTVVENHGCVVVPYQTDTGFSGAYVSIPANTTSRMYPTANATSLKLKSAGGATDVILEWSMA